MDAEIVFVGCESVQGKKKDTGVPYGPFYQVHYLAPIQEVNTDNRQVSGIGYQPKVVNVESNVFAQFRDKKPMTKVSVVVGADPQNLNRTVIQSVN